MICNFKEVSNVSSKDFEQAMSIYLDTIAAEERQSLDVIKKRIAANGERMFVGRSEYEVVLVALIFPHKHTRFVLLDYLATKRAYRNQGLGSIFVKIIFQITQIKNKTFIFEPDDPRYGCDREEKTRRLEFYRRNGAKEMKSVTYVLPPLQGEFSSQMIVMLISPQKQTTYCLTGQTVKKLFRQIYIELYSRAKNDYLLKTFIDLVPPKVELV